MTGVFGIFALAGCIVFLGLAGGQPVRGAIEIAWGVELQPGELYGPAIARAYELESAVAEYPRIVVGHETVQFLDSHINNPENDPLAQYNRSMAQMCRSMLARDVDGTVILNYLGEEFQKSITQSIHTELYSKARTFIAEQLTKHRDSGNIKLAFRYTSLGFYFDTHNPLGPGLSEAEQRKKRNRAKRDRKKFRR